MSRLLEQFNARAAQGPIPLEELIAVRDMATKVFDEKAYKALVAAIRDTWGTPPELFAQLHERYRFTVDVAAEPWNTKLSRWFGPGGEVENAFEASLVGETWFCNPPFSEIERWLRWIWSFYDPSRPRAGLGVLLIPATRMEQDWWMDLIEPFLDPAAWPAIGCSLQREQLRGRTHYVPPPGIEASSPRFGSLLLKWNPLPLSGPQTEHD